MKTTLRGELPDGRLVKVEGGDLESAALFAVNSYGTNGSWAVEQSEEPLSAKPFTLERQHKQEVTRFEHRTLDKLQPPVISNVPVANYREEALPLPRMD